MGRSVSVSHTPGLKLVSATKEADTALHAPAVLRHTAHADGCQSALHFLVCSSAEQQLFDQILVVVQVFTQYICGPHPHTLM